MLRFFKSNNPSRILFLLLLTAVFGAVLFVRPPQQPLTAEGGLFWQVIVQLLALAGKPSWLIALLSAIVVFFLALMLNALITHYKVIDDVGFLPSYIFVLTAFWLPEAAWLSPALLAAIFLLWMLYPTFSTYQRPTAFLQVYDMGLLMGVAILFYQPMLLMLPVLFIAIGILRPFIWREWVISVLGLGTPFLLAAVTLYWLNFPLPLWHELSVTEASAWAFNLREKVSAPFVLVLLAPALLTLQRNYMRSPIQVRKYIQLFLWALLFAVPAYALSGSHGPAHFAIITVPLSFIIAYWLATSGRRKLLEAVHWLWWVLILTFHYLPLIQKITGL